MPLDTAPRPLDSTGVKVLLGILKAMPLWRRIGDTGLRITDRRDGSVLIEAIGYPTRAEGFTAVAEADKVLGEAGLWVDVAPLSVSPHRARLVRRSS